MKFWNALDRYGPAYGFYFLAVVSIILTLMAQWRAEQLFPSAIKSSLVVSAMNGVLPGVLPLFLLMTGRTAQMISDVRHKLLNEKFDA